MEALLDIHLERINQARINQILTYWPKKSHKLAESVIHTYGLPHEATPSMLIWYYNSPWKRTVVHRDGVEHNIPRPHTDLLEQIIDTRISPEACAEIAKFDGSIAMNRTRGEMTAYCQNEAANTFILNLAHDIALGNKTPEEARAILIESDGIFHHMLPNPYKDALQFDSRVQGDDPDRITAEPN